MDLVTTPVFEELGRSESIIIISAEFSEYRRKHKHKKKDKKKHKKSEKKKKKKSKDHKDTTEKVLKLPE